MKVELINRTNYANIYGVYDETGKPIGTAEIVLAGRNAGTYYYSLTGKHTKNDIRKIFNQYRK